MSDNNLLMEAIDYVDDSYLAKYFNIKEKIAQNKRKKTTKVWIKYAIAACLCFCVICVAIYTPHIIELITEGQMKVYYQGNVAENKYGSLILVENDSSRNTCSFTLRKTDDTPLYIKFSGYVVKEEWTDEQGINRQKVQQVDIITPFDDYTPENGREVVDVNLLIYVNGNKVDELPTDAGEYEISIDYSGLYDVLDHVDPAIEVRKFGIFIIE